MTFRDLEIYFTSDLYKVSKSLCDYYRDGFIIDEEAGKIYLTIGYNSYYGYYENYGDCNYLEACYIFLDNQITENEYHVCADSIII